MQHSNQQHASTSLNGRQVNRSEWSPSPSNHNRSFDAGSPGQPFGVDPNNSALNYGAIPPLPRTKSKEFSAMNELTSVISPLNSVRKQSPVKPNHRRAASDTFVNPSMIYYGPVPPQEYNSIAPQSLHGRTNSYGGGQPSQHPVQSFRGQPNARDVAEMEALLSQQNMNNHHRSNSYRAGRPKTHMRQNSVNLYMKSHKGEVQPKSCKDIFYGVLFVIQLLVIVVVGLKYGPDALADSEEQLGPGEGVRDDDAYDEEHETRVVLEYWNVIKMASTCGAFAMIVSALALAFMMAMSRRLVYVALVLSIGVSFAWGTIGIGISPKSFVPISGIIALMLTVGYMFVVWDRIPFASANLTTALTGVRSNLGLVAVAFLFQFLALVCSVYYTVTFFGINDTLFKWVELSENVNNEIRIAVDIVLILSYYWTYQVLRHIVMVTVAGTIGSWWFNKPSALHETFTRATFYNFGSICYGSLFVGPVQFLRQITEGLRPNRDDSAMICFYECSLFFQEKIVSCVDGLADSFTPWAFTYVGLYNYGLKDAGHKANELFEKRGWSRIVTDDLIPSVLLMVSLVIGGLSGSFAVILEALDGKGLGNFGHPMITSFMIGFVVGIVLSTVLFSIIDSSVNAAIVCFAGSPVEFHRNHPVLSHEMRHAWKEVWPGSLDIDGSGAGLA